MSTQQLFNKSNHNLLPHLLQYKSVVVVCEYSRTTM